MIIRLTTVANIIHFWDFIERGLRELEKKLDQPYDLEAVRKTLIHLVPDHQKTWIAIAVAHEDPVAFVVCQESTQLFEKQRTFVVQWFYHSPLSFPATFELMEGFEAWAKGQGVIAYGVTTCRSSGAAIRCFQSEKFGFHKSHITFEKKLV